MPDGALPSVTTVVVNLDGEDLLPACLDSLRTQDYDGEHSVVVVDNGSTDGSLELLAEKYPEVVVLPQGRNTGFAAAVNVGARAAAGECVALLNNDMRVDRDWLSELVRHLDEGSGTACVGGLILSDDGATVDFADASVSFNGIGDQPGFGRSLADVELDDGRELLFACGGSLLVRRDVFLDTGGFDESFFAYFEDVDFGWRLNLFGCRVVLATGARSYHLHHGTAGRFPRYQRELLIERNALVTALKNYDDAHLAEVLPVALLLMARRGVSKAGIDRPSFDIGGSPDEEQVVGRDVLATLVALADLVDDLPGLLERRRAVQERRQRTDDELIARFGFPLRPPTLDPGYLRSQVALIRELGLDDAFQRQRAARVVVVGADDDEALTTLVDTAGRVAPTRRVSDEDEDEELWRTSDVILARPATLADHRPGTWPVVVAVVDGESGDDVLARVDAVLTLDHRDRPIWEALVEEQEAAPVLLEGAGPEALAPVLHAPWKLRERRRLATWRASVTEDVNLLLDAGRAEVADAESRLRHEQRARGHDLQLLAELRVALELRRNEVEDLHFLLREAQAEAATHRAELDRMREETPPTLVARARARVTGSRRRA